MKKDTSKGFIIDFILLAFYAILLLYVTKYLYFVHSWSRGSIAILYFISIPFIWGTMIFSLMGKNTIGQLIIKKTSVKK